MSKAPKRPSERNGLKQQDNEGGAPRSSRGPARKPRSASKRKVETALDSLSTEIPNGAMEGPDRNIPASIPQAQDDTRAKARNLITEGDQKGKRQQGSDSVIWDEANQQAQAVASAEAIHREDANQTGESNLPRSPFGVEGKPDPTEMPSQHHPITPKIRSESLEGAKNPSRPSSDGEAPRVAGVVGTPHLEAASEPLRSASGHVKVWSQDTTIHQTQQSIESGEPANPIFILAGITLGIPALALIALIGMNPGVQGGTFMTLLTFLVISVFVIAAVFEIKRLADQHSDDGEH